MIRRLALAPLLLLVACCGGPAPQPAPLVVGTHWPGATASEMDLLVGRSLETSVIGIAGVTGTRSLSMGADHALWVEYEGSRVEGRMRLVDALAQVQLPVDASPPWLGTGGSSLRPRLWIVLSGDTARDALSAAADEIALAGMTVVGTERADVRGSASQRVAIRVEHARAAAYGVTPNELVEAVHAASSEGTLDALAHTPVGGRTAQIVLLADVATVEYGPGARRSRVSAGGAEAVLVELVAATDVERATFEEAVTAALERTLPTLPEGVDVAVVAPDEAGLVVDVTGPRDAEFLDRIAAELSELADELGADEIHGQVGVPIHADVPRAIDDGTARLHLGWSGAPPEGARERLRVACEGHPGVSCWVHSPHSATATLVVTAGDEAALEVAAEVADAAAGVTGVLSAHHVAPPQEPVISVRPDRDKLARLGLSPADVSRAVTSATVGLAAGQAFDGHRYVPIVLHWGEIEQDDARAIADLEVFGTLREAPIPLMEVCTIELGAEPRAIRRVNGLWATNVLVELPTRGQGRVRKRLEAAVREVALPGGAAVTFE